jgi:thioredoxin-dependent peroxiredoxin
VRLKEGEAAPHFELEDIFGKRVSLDQLRGHRSMISFYRYSGCPFCNVRLAGLIRAHPSLHERGLVMLSFWQSPKADILETVGTQEPPFPLIPDPQKRIYALYGVENRFGAPWKVLLEPKLAVRALRSPFMKLKISGEVDLVPADFLLNPDLTIHAAYYGKHVGDHIPIKDIKRFLGDR